jgi:hypothetical protein
LVLRRWRWNRKASTCPVLGPLLWSQKKDHVSRWRRVSLSSSPVLGCHHGPLAQVLAAESTWEYVYR